MDDSLTDKNQQGGQATVDRFLNETQAARERLKETPGDVAALAALGRALDFLAFDQADDARQLVAAANNLLDRLIEGTIDANAESAALLNKACLAFQGSEDERGDMAEALDVFASGLGALEPPPTPAPSAPSRRPPPEPPLLTIRDNGERVVPGAFEPAAAATPAAAPEPEQPTVDRPVEEAPQQPYSSQPSIGEPEVSEPSVRVGRGRAPLATEPEAKPEAEWAAEPERNQSPAPQTPVSHPAPSPQSASGSPKDGVGDRQSADLLDEFAAAMDKLSAQIDTLARLGGQDIEEAIGELSATRYEIARIKEKIAFHLSRRSTG